MSLIDSPLKIRVLAHDGRIGRVEIVSPRVDVAQIFRGRELGEVYAMAANLFALCPAAQSIAAQAAGEAALGRPPEVCQHRTRVLRLHCERLGEMLRASLLSWPQDAAPDVETLACLRESLAALHALPEQGEAAPRLYESIRQAALRLGLRDYAEGGLSLFARQWADVVGDEPNWRLRPLDVDPLRPADDDAVAKAMAAPDFSRAPSLPGRCVETGASARQAGGGFANTLSGRLAARFADMAAALDMIGLLLAGEPPPPDALAAKSLAPGEGFAAVELARGKLFHRIRLDGAGRIVDYSIVAPTEWNFHPDGPLVRLLRGADIGAGEAAKQRVERLAFVFDPCLRVAAELLENAHA